MMNDGARMQAFTLLVALLVALAAPFPARAVDLSAPLVCALTDVFDCSGDDCVEVEAETVGVPDLMRLDPKAKTLTALDVELAGAGSALDSLSAEKGKLGARAHDGDRLLALSIDAVSGDTFLTVTDLHLSLIAYGTCAKE